uniref:Uncharacterized protein n=1 Tax=Ananas comosus var. bracteatus TaxID=296719 RepID=A0A6V7NTN5_ANACO|nr:unnamed protein product [Ananas comosus var. bracteatus]
MPLETSPATDHPDISDRALTALRSHREASSAGGSASSRTSTACEPSSPATRRLHNSLGRQSFFAGEGSGASERAEDSHRRHPRLGPSVDATETDEVIVLPTATANPTASVFEASVCCNDRSDLYSELVATLRSLRLKTLRAEIATVGGRVRSVLVLSREAGDDEEEEEENRHVDGEEEEEEEEEDRDVECGKGGGGDFLRDALRGLVHRPAPAADRSKRQRVVDRRST